MDDRTSRHQSKWTRLEVRTAACEFADSTYQPDSLGQLTWPPFFCLKIEEDK